METPPLKKATVQMQKAIVQATKLPAQLQWMTKALLPEAAGLPASTAQAHSREALARTRAAKPPLQRTPVLAQKGQPRRQLLSRAPTFCRRSSGRLRQGWSLPRGLKNVRSGDCTKHNRGAWRRE